MCAAFGLTASEANTEIMCLRAEGMSEYTATFSVEAAGQVYGQTNESVYLGGNVDHNADLSIEVDPRIHTQRVVQLPEVHPRTVRPTDRSSRAQNPDAKSRGARDNAVRLRHVEPARVPLRHAAPSPPQILDSLHRMAKAQSRRPPDFLSGHACQNGKCLFSSHSFWTSSSLDVPAGVPQEEGHTGFLIHIISAVHALIFLARRIQPFLSLVDCEVEFCVLTI